MADNRIYRISQLASRRLKDGTFRQGITGLGESAIYLRVAAGTFPKPIDLGGRARGWLSDDISAWMQARAAASRDVDQVARRPRRRTAAKQEQEPASAGA
jgi:prophage regulatory protein